MADPNAVAQAFVQHYYGVFDSNRSQLGALYSDDSMLTFEDKQVKGAEAIVQTLVALPFQQIKHIAKTIDAQPSAGGGVLVFVSGDVHIDGNANGVKFSECFMLLPNAGGFFVLNSLFRLNYS